MLRIWLAVALAAAPPAWAQAPATTVPGVTVGTPKNRHIDAAQALDFVQSHSKPALSGQLARWTQPICPQATGVPADVSAYVSARVREVAAIVGAPVSKQNRCTTNVEIVFTNTPQAVVDLIARTQGALLGFHYVAQLNALKAVTHPIQAWYLTGTQNIAGQQSMDVASGMDASDTVARGIANGSPTTSVITSDANSDFNRMQVMGQEPAGCPGSRFTHCLHSLFLHVLIVVDGKALYGRKIGPLVDYIALLALTQPSSLDGCDAMPSILDLLSARCADRPRPDGVTDGDLAYLTGLYKTDLETELVLERTGIVDNMMHYAAQARR
jgi:hypothetical protein